ncbi:hypothetical protein DKX38_007203 [Salix brachista]|uniref:Aminotransferase-like plant mobile domain-containing protein n=1 Tax=Salix brachista TaxID=2182728 RepID=A0A5N5MMJ1_9ROSI|nr:hypothetical protein DKX38_007203 [Salix brachista]
MAVKGLQYKSNLFGIVKEFETANITESLKMELMKTPFWTLIRSMLEGTLDKHICRKSDLSICKILQTYNKDEEVFKIKGKDIKIYAEDIRLIFGIRDGNIQIDVNKHKTARMRNKTAFETRCFPKVERLTKREINNAFKRLNSIESKNPSDRNVQDMCRVLVLKLLVSLFLPNNGSNLPFAYLEYVEDLESIAEYNWAAHIFDFFKKSLDEKEASEVIGCVMTIPFSVVYLEPTEKEIELLGDKRDVELLGDQRAMKLLAEEEEETNVKEAAFSVENEDDNEKEISELECEKQKLKDQLQKAEEEIERQQVEYMGIIGALNKQNAQLEQRVKDLEDQLTKVAEKGEKTDKELSLEVFETRPTKRKQIEKINCCAGYEITTPLFNALFFPSSWNTSKATREFAMQRRISTLQSTRRLMFPISRTYLNLPSEIVPATLKKQSKPAGGWPFGGPPGDRPRGPPRLEGDRPRFGDRDGYRGGPRGGQALVVEEEVMVQPNPVLLALLEDAANPSILLCSYLTSGAELRTFCALVLLLAI